MHVGVWCVRTNNFKIKETWVKVQNFPNPKLKKFDSKNLQHAYKILTISVLIGQLSLDELKINQRSYHIQPNSAFWGYGKSASKS